jgi:hypothetical protein
VNYARFHLFEQIRFSANVENSPDPNVSSAQQPEGLLAAGFPLRIRVLRTEMKFVLAQNFPIGPDACDAATAVEALRRDLILFS